MKLVSAKPNRATFGKKKLSLFLELEYLAVYGRTSAEGGGRLGVRHDFVMDRQKRDYSSHASQRARGVTNKNWNWSCQQSETVNHTNHTV